MTLWQALHHPAAGDLVREEVFALDEGGDLLRGERDGGLPTLPDAAEHLALPAALLDAGAVGAGPHGACGEGC